MGTLKLFLAALVIGPALDFVWFSLVASDLYKKEIGSILRLKADGSIAANMWAAIPVYVLIAALVALFVVPKAGGSVLAALLWGALAGLIAYGIYDFTNMSFLKDWTWTAAVADVLWGTFMVGALSAAVAWIQRLLA